MDRPVTHLPSGLPLLERDFFRREPAEVARDLLGRYLVRDYEGQVLKARITETEAYGGPLDSASHASRGPTPRNQPMFGPPGHAYLYLIYGLYDLLNIVTGPMGEAGAVLIRAVQPIQGEAVMQACGNGRRYPALCNGPGKLTRAMAITRAHWNRHDLCLGRGIWLETGGPAVGEETLAGPRVGIDYAAPADRDAPLRFRLVRRTGPDRA